MKIGSDYLYPYPVLNDFSEDYIRSTFGVNYHIKEKGFKTKIVVANFILVDEVIEGMISENKASMVLHLECPRTSYRKVFKLAKEQNTTEIIIDDQIMKHKLEMTGIIVVNQEIKVYKNDNINPDYYGDNYEIRNLDRGNIIAISLTQEIDIPASDDDFERVSSVINVGLSKDEYMSVDMDGDIIIIKLPEKQYNQYYTLSGTEYSSIVMTSTIFPSLIHVLDRMSSKDNLVDPELTWYQVVEKKLKTKGIMIEDINEVHSSVKLAQMLLEDPLERALGELQTKAEGE